MKRLLSVILIAAMVFTFVPAAFATGGETEPEEIIIEFSDKTVFKADGTKFTAATSGVTKENYKTDPACFEIVDEESHYTRKLTIVKSRNNTTQTDHMLCLFYVFRHKGNDATAIADRYGEFAIKTPRLKAGKYSVKIKAAKTSNAGEFEVYVNGTDIGSFNALDTTATEYAKSFEFLEQDLGDVEVTPDDDGYTKIRFTSILANKGANNGYAYLTAYQLIFTEIPEDEALTNAFTPDNATPDEDYNEPKVITISKDGMDEIVSVKNADGTHNITAPEENKAGKKFLYWAKGLSAQKRILLGKTNKLENYVPDAEYANWLIPVYEGDISGVEYYNANGQLIPDADENTTVSMPGYGTSNGWDKYGENIFVATYELAKPEKNIDITVNGDTDTYAFGDVVECTAEDKDADGNPFKCWKKNNEIVSVDKEYTFKAWETCTVTAVYEDHTYTGNKMKIIIDSFDVATGVTGVMAEFIGLDSAVEKGIMLVDKDEKETKIAMTTKDNQFTVTADVNGKYKGYAIVGDADSGYTLITDGLVTVSDAE